MVHQVTIYCDGACLGNPGPGGYAALLMSDSPKQQERVVCGREPSTTNNRMELRAAIEGLRSLKRSCSVRVFCDSLYVVKGMNEWMQAWIKNQFRTANNKPVKNADLWQELVEIVRSHRVSWHWVKAHAGNVHNERVDEIAREQAGLALHELSYNP